VTISYELTTDIGKTRLFATDTDVQDAIFFDEELQVFLDATGDAPMLAAAMALETIASDAAKLAVKTRQDVLSTDPTAIPAELRAQAKALREQYAANSAGSLTLVSPPDAVFVLPVAPEVGNMEPW
jgi:hypothetical protein